MDLHMERTRLLFVDDEPNGLASIVRTLKDEPFLVSTAVSGREALNLLEHQCFDIIVADQNMPHMSGIELLATIKEYYPSILRVILTGDTHLTNALEAINRASVHRFFSKPIRAHDLSKALRDIAKERNY